MHEFGSYVCVQGRNKQFCMGTVDASLSTLILCTIDSSLFPKYTFQEDIDKNNTLKLLLAPLIASLDISSSMKDSANIQIQLTRSLLIASITPSEGVRVVRNFYSLESSSHLYRASHQPCHEYPIHISIIASTILPQLKSLFSTHSLNTNIQLDFRSGKISSVGLSISGKYSTSSIFLDPSDLATIRVNKSVSLLISASDFMNVTNLAAELDSMLDLYCESHEKYQTMYSEKLYLLSFRPVILQINQLDGIKVECAMSALEATTTISEKGDNEFLNISDADFESDAAIIPDSFAEDHPEDSPLFDY